MKKHREMIENKTPRDHIEYVEICKTIKKKAREDILITLLDKQVKEVQEQDKIMERIEEFYSELYDSNQAVTIQTDPKKYHQ